MVVANLLIICYENEEVRVVLNIEGQICYSKE